MIQSWIVCWNFTIYIGIWFWRILTLLTESRFEMQFIELGFVFCDWKFRLVLGFFFLLDLHTCMIKNKYFVSLFSFFICTKNTLKYYSKYKNIHTCNISFIWYFEKSWCDTEKWKWYLDIQSKNTKKKFFFIINL